MKKIYISPISKITQMRITSICEKSSDFGGEVDPFGSKKRGKNSTTEDLFEDEEETSFWH